MEAGDGGRETPAGPSRGVSVRRKVAIGCFTSWLGLVSGAMVAALLSKFVAFLTRAQECDGIPSCNWYVWAGIGGLIGAVTLPVLVLLVLGKPAKGANTNPDGGF
jgi:hypothetical protein